MSNIVAFPKSQAAHLAEAEEYLRMEMRMQLAAACGILTKNPSRSDLCDILDRMADVAGLVSQLVAIREACR